ncbi:DNA double-strand break repair helicase HerA [Candidatus Methanobinarius endosymbioticus]|uniref:DNA double-strand break repair helicase HerA n=1 Tax=Candidatus Methanobinarius endosymbioticus TaxID=2006182 RepID=A0A366M9J6_9EURY|nr:DNA double-strand break repair helicase HerA [Candidatus Methanobinarius endosymbioticus]
MYKCIENLLNNFYGVIMIIGRCVGETSLIDVSFISKEMPKVGEYVSLYYDGKTVLGMIESLVRGSASLNGEIYDPNTIEKIREIEGEDFYIKGNVRILGDIDDNLKIPRTPVPPGTEIKIADENILKKIFKVDNGLKIGNLISQDEVDVRIDINKMVSRHLAILAMTGAGKSNTVSVLIDGLLECNGCILIFDMHSEYVGAEFKNGEVNRIDPIINPIYMSFAEIKGLTNIPSSAYIQERYFREAYKESNAIVKSGEADTKDFVEIMRNVLEKWYNTEMFRGKELNSSDKSKIMDVINKVDDLQTKYDNLLNINAGNILSQLKLGKANVLDLGQTDEASAEVIVSHVLRNGLKSIKAAMHNKEENMHEKPLDFPVFFIMEEAHILAPKNRNTASKYWISRIAREGRKFGLGLCLVSQSPKSVEPDALSQVNNMIILRLVEPQDQRHVQSASESLSEDLVKQLPSLNVGEAMVLGLMVKVPTLVKIDEFKGRTVGGDINILDQWKNNKSKEIADIKDQEDEFKQLGGDY